jgi:tRNA(Ile2) C34 agmatinyltransferase TiaS
MIFASEPSGTRVVRCPGCGRRATLAGDESAVASCARCTTRLMTYRRSFDVEHSVRERLYGYPRRSVETAPSRGLTRSAYGLPTRP